MDRQLTTYFRFDPPQDLSQINPLDGTRMADIETIVHDYVGGPDVCDRLAQCANKLQVLLFIQRYVSFSICITGSQSLDARGAFFTSFTGKDGTRYWLLQPCDFLS